MEGGWSKLHRDCSWERERQRGGRPTLSFFLRVGEERGRINRLICHARSHTHISDKQTHNNTAAKQASSGSAAEASAAAVAAVRERDKETERERETGKEEEEADALHRLRSQTGERERQAFSSSTTHLRS